MVHIFFILLPVVAITRGRSQFIGKMSLGKLCLEQNLTHNTSEAWPGAMHILTNNVFPRGCVKYWSVEDTFVVLCQDTSPCCTQHPHSVMDLNTGVYLKEKWSSSLACIFFFFHTYTLKRRVNMVLRKEKKSNEVPQTCIGHRRYVTVPVLPRVGCN